MKTLALYRPSAAIAHAARLAALRLADKRPRPTPPTRLIWEASDA